MTSYADDIQHLAARITGLVAAGPPPPGALPDADRPAVLTARDALAGELRSLTAVLLGPARADTDGPDLLTRSPARALHAALAALPHAAGEPLPLSDALTAATGSPYTRGWQATARAAVTLERHHHTLTRLPGGQAWAAARDIAELTAALPHLDADLAGQLPDGMARTVLSDPVAHTRLRLAADELRARTADLPAGPADTGLAERPRPQPLRSAADLPEATRQLGLLLTHRGPHLTAAEVRAAARALTDGADATARHLLAAAPTGRTAAAAADLRGALPHLQRLLHEPLATVTPPAPAVLHLAREIRGHLNTLPSPTASTSRAHPHRPGATPHPNPAGTPGLLIRWAAEAAGAAGALRDSLQRAASTNRLLAPAYDADSDAQRHLLWRHLVADDNHPLLYAAEAASQALTSAARHLEEGVSHATVGARSAARTAALHAGRPFDGLHNALQTRPQLPQPARPSHPATTSPDGQRLHR